MMARSNDVPFNTIEWRGSGADSPAKDQASCGSCWVRLSLLVFKTYLALAFCHNLYLKQVC